jgi:hypothetical protein
VIVRIARVNVVARKREFAPVRIATVTVIVASRRTNLSKNRKKPAKNGLFKIIEKK